MKALSLIQLGSLTTLEGLENLAGYNELIIQSCSQLTTLKHLSSNLPNDNEIVAENILINQNPYLKDILGLKPVRYISSKFAHFIGCKVYYQQSCFLLQQCIRYLIPIIIFASLQKFCHWGLPQIWPTFLGWTIWCMLISSSYSSWQCRTYLASIASSMPRKYGSLETM